MAARRGKIYRNPVTGRFASKDAKPIDAGGRVRRLHVETYKRDIGGRNLPSERIGRGTRQRIKGGIGGTKTQLTKRRRWPGGRAVAKHLKELSERRGNPVYVRVRIKYPDGSSRWVTLPLTDYDTFETGDILSELEDLIDEYGEGGKVTSWTTGEVF